MPSEFIAGSNTIAVDIVDRDRNIIGPGPLMTCLGLDFDSLLSQPGAFTARFPANDERLQYLQLKRHLLHFYVNDILVFYGMAEAWSHEISNDGQHILIVTGRDTLAELEEVTIVDLTLEDAAAPIFDAPTQILLYSLLSDPTLGWGIGGNNTTATGVYGSFKGETVLAALTRIAEHIGEAFRMDFGRAITWIGTSSPASNVRAVQSAGDAITAEDNEFICFIQSLTERRDATRLITTIYPTGSGIGDTQLDLEGTDRVVPAGFTLNEAENSLTSDAALAYIGKTIGRRVNFKDIRPLFNTDADLQSAKNYLFDAALAYLQRNDDVDDVVEYDLDVLKLPRFVQVGMTLHVTYQDDFYDLDQEFKILGIRTSVSTDGAVTYKLTIASTNQWRLRETSAVVAQIEEGEIFAAHPQIDANTYWENFREEVGDSQTDHLAEFPFFLSAEVVTIRQVLFRYMVDRVLVGTKSYAYASAATDQNVASPTGDSTITIATTDITIATTDITIGTTDIAIADAALTVNTTGGTTLSTETPDTGNPNDFFTQTNYLGNATATQDPGATWAVPATHYHQIGTHVHEHVHHHTVASHSHTPTAEHGHTIANHSHTDTPHSHADTPHTHADTPHTHTNTAHSHSSPQHVHNLPALTETFGLLRVPALNSYVIADLEYSVNGGAWVSLGSGIPVAGGYSEIDITSEIQNPSGLKRPLQEYNVVQVRRKTSAGTGKSALIRAKLGIRTTIQSIVAYS